MLSSRKGKLDQGMNLNTEYYSKKNSKQHCMQFLILLKYSFKNRLFTALSYLVGYQCNPRRVASLLYTTKLSFDLRNARNMNFKMYY